VKDAIDTEQITEEMEISLGKVINMIGEFERGCRVIYEKV